MVSSSKPFPLAGWDVGTGAAVAFTGSAVFEEGFASGLLLEVVLEVVLGAAALEAGEASFALGAGALLVSGAVDFGVGLTCAGAGGSVDAAGAAGGSECELPMPALVPRHAM